MMTESEQQAMRHDNHLMAREFISFIKLCKVMRKCQEDYIKTKDRSKLRQAKALEAKVDNYISNIFVGAETVKPMDFTPMEMGILVQTAMTDFQ